VLDYNHPGSITGSVDGNGGKLNGMYAIVMPADQLRAIAVAVTGPSGSFSISNLPPGTYKLVTVDPAYLGGASSYFQAEFYDNGGGATGDFATATTIVVNPGVPTALNAINLTHT